MTINGAQSLDCVLSDIFAPFKAEWCSVLEFGSLWTEWVGKLSASVEELRRRQSLLSDSQ
jgi:hypothetical protein